MAIQRGCGTRQEGGLYLEVNMGVGGHPYQEFFKDPPVPVDPVELGLSPIGVKVLRQEGSDSAVIFDWIGRDSYPNAADILEEMAAVDKRTGALAGLSRRLSTQAPLEKLGPNPSVALLHARALLPDGEQTIYRAADQAVRFFEVAREAGESSPPFHGGCGRKITHGHCRPDLELHEGGPEVQCTATWWADLDPTTCEFVDWDSGTARRSFGDTTYWGLIRTGGMRGVQHRLGIIAVFPISRLVVVADPMGGRDERTLRAIEGRTSLPIDLVEE